MDQKHNKPTRRRADGRTQRSVRGRRELRLEAQGTAGERCRPTTGGARGSQANGRNPTAPPKEDSKAGDTERGTKSKGEKSVLQDSLHVSLQKQALLGEDQTLSPPNSILAMDTENDAVSMETNLSVPASDLQLPPPR